MRQDSAPGFPVPLTTFEGNEAQPAFSPDGSQFAFAWNQPGNATDIFVRRVSGEAPRRLTTHPAFDYYPRWSPDGRTIAFWRRLEWEGSELILIPAGGGAEQSLGSFHGPVTSNLKVVGPYLEWMPDGARLVLGVSDAEGGQFRLSMLSLADRKLTPLFDPPPGVLGDAGPALSPDGKRLAFHRFLGQGTSQIYVASVAGGAPRAVTFDRKFNPRSGS